MEKNKYVVINQLILKILIASHIGVCEPCTVPESVQGDREGRFKDTRNNCSLKLCWWDMMNSYTTKC